jgi:biopolymer transport protein ExbD
MKPKRQGADMRIRRQNTDSEEIINMSSLLDVMFILIIFFLATTTFKEQEVDEAVNLPVQAKGEALSADNQLIVINVRKSGTYVLMDQQVTVEEMDQMIRETLTENPEMKVLVRADQEALHGWVAQAIAICRNAGVLKANIGYKLLN